MSGKKCKKNVFCKVELLNGEVKTYQFPNDLRKAMLESYYSGELKEMMQGALINIPTTAYTANGKVKLAVGKVKSVFVANRSQRWRTRGQFLTKDNWCEKVTKANKKFLLHDHSLLNKIRISWCVMRWRLKEKG